MLAQLAKSKLARLVFWGFSLMVLFFSHSALAHDPIFSIGSHVIYKGGIEVASEASSDKVGGDRANQLGLELTYGITGDWSAGIDVPYTFQEEGTDESNGLSDFSAFTKYRFWRHDTSGAQETAAVLAKVKFDTADRNDSPALGTGSTDAILGLTYGYESRKWYRWASARYRYNGENDAGLQRGSKVLLDLVGGIRPRPTNYLKPDTVWLLELNGEYGQRAELNGATLNNTGGTEWYLSPGIFWTLRNFAIKAGVQLPIYSHLNGNQKGSDYRAKVVFEWHL